MADTVLSERVNGLRFTQTFRVTVESFLVSFSFFVCFRLRSVGLLLLSHRMGEGSSEVGTLFAGVGCAGRLAAGADEVAMLGGACDGCKDAGRHGLPRPWLG